MQEKRLSWQDLKDGVHYLTDYYAMYGVSRDELQGINPAAIRKLLNPKRKEFASQYHTDKYEHLPASFKLDAGQMFQAAENGFGTLSNVAKRKKYDRLLEQWDGPISENGAPVYDPRFFSIAEFRAASLPEKRKVIDRNPKGLAESVGYNEKTHQALAKLAAMEDSQETRDALDEYLMRKEMLVIAYEQMWWMFAGSPRGLIQETAPVGYLGEVRTRIESSRESVVEDASRTLADVSSGRLQLESGAHDAAVLSVDPQVALVQLTQTLLAPLTEATPHLEMLAAQREQLFEERLALSIDYRPMQRVLYPNLLFSLVVQGESKIWGIARWDSVTQTISCDSVNPTEFSKLSDRSEARKWIRKGYNVMFVSIREDYVPKTQRDEAIRRHFDLYQDQVAAKRRKS